MAGLRQPIAPTPVSELGITLRGSRHRLLLKHECHNPSGSVKDRTAIGLLRALDRARPLRPGTTVVESTSGNLGIALATQLARLDCHLIAVIDPKTPLVTRQTLLAAGASIRLVDEPDGQGGYLMNRLSTVRELCRRNPRYRWTNQYENPANPDIHAQTTAPEILRQGGPDLDAVYVAVSTGGTIAGIARHIRPRNGGVRLIAVDADPSLATAGPDLGGQPAGGSPRARAVPGIGASRRSSFLVADSFDRRATVRDPDAIAMCRILRADTGVGVGGSTGFVLRACVADLAGAEPFRLPLCLSPDDASKYEDTVYDDRWLDHVGLTDSVGRAVDRLRADGLTIELVHGPTSWRGAADGSPVLRSLS
ncbi:cysteine synthase A [Asanoa hainanensis]|uniref:Cysteine synthase A n=1 Tax=Asanoa hainanensis TaxID=560556 RepID=A0A239N250_9ACTN|nr:pyridoxal-phosphate dependent enzyme [Asanoa hainanensis]SNT48553.1 cysteine synthase A [Asanoa hainanensis]